MPDHGNGAQLLATEVPARAMRRRFTAEYKRRILSELDGCTAAGAVGALLRREGLYSSHLRGWRQAREKGALAGLSKKRGRKVQETDETQELRRLRRENERLRTELGRAEKIIDVQKKVSEILGVDLNPPESDEND